MTQTTLFDTPLAVHTGNLSLATYPFPSRYAAPALVHDDTLADDAWCLCRGGARVGKVRRIKDVGFMCEVRAAMKKEGG
jgi:hypothetical protein